MTATRHVSPAPPATTCLAVPAVLAVLVAACGAGLGGATSGPVAGVGVLAAVALAVPAGWWLAARLTVAWSGETHRPGKDRLGQAAARALAGWLCGAAQRVWVGAAVGWPVLHAVTGLAETGVAIVGVACRRERDGPGERGRGLAAASAPPRAGALCRAGHGGLAGGGLSDAVGASGGSAGLCRDGPPGVACAGTGHPRVVTLSHQPSTGTV